LHAMKTNTYLDIRQSLTTLYRADPLTIFDKELPIDAKAVVAPHLTVVTNTSA